MARELRSNFQIPENFEFPEVLPRTCRKQQTMADPNVVAAIVAVPETLHVNPYHGKFNPQLKQVKRFLKRKPRVCLGTSASLQQRKIPREFVAYYKQNIHRWAQWLLEPHKNMMARSM